MTFHVPRNRRVVSGPMASTPEDGDNGAFLVRVGAKSFFVIASDGMGWEHVSVTRYGGNGKPPSWDEMCAIKAVFWDPDDCVVQYHPPESQYVNNHPGCLHLWRPICQTVPMPPSIAVGLRGVKATA